MTVRKAQKIKKKPGRSSPPCCFKPLSHFNSAVASMAEEPNGDENAEKEGKKTNTSVKEV